MRSVLKSNVVMTLVLFVIGLVLGALMLAMGFENNNQGEFFNPETGKIDMAYCLLLLFLPSIFLASPMFGYTLIRWIIIKGSTP